MVIDGVGRVGIGISNPIAPLHITGPAPIATQPVIKVERNSPVVDYQDTNATSGYLFFTERFSNLAGSVISTRKVQQNPGGSGVYTIFNNGLLTGQGTEHNQRNNSFHWKIDNSTNEVLTINTSGNVGIGATDPLSVLDVDGVIANRAADNDTNFTVSTTGMSKVASGSLQFTQGFSGTSSSGDRVQFTYQATSWKSWSLDYTFASTDGLVKGTIGGYNNNSGGGNNSFLKNDMNITAVATNFGQIVIVTFTGNFGVHMMCDMRYSQGGGDGAPRSDRASLNYIS